MSLCFGLEAAMRGKTKKRTKANYVIINKINILFRNKTSILKTETKEAKLKEIFFILLLLQKTFSYLYIHNFTFLSWRLLI